MAKNEVEPPSTSDFGLLSAAIRAVPEVKYALGVAGIAAAVALVRGLLPGVPFETMLPIIIGSIVAMAALLIFVRAAGPQAGKSLIGEVFLWAVCIFIIAILGLTASAIAIGWPKVIANMLPHGASESSGASAIRTELQSGKQGYVYYEVSADGQLTDDGRLSPTDNSPMLPFDRVNVGAVLQAQDQVQLRSPLPDNTKGATPRDARRLATLLPGQCVAVRDGHRYTVEVERAASGGWLPVTVTRCTT